MSALPTGAKGLQSTMATIPPVEIDVLTQAIARFDSELREFPEWADWETKESQKYAIEYDGRLYPPKQIIGMATGATDFPDSDQATSYLTERGFNIVPLQPSDASRVKISQADEPVSLSGSFVEIMRLYDSADVPVAGHDGSVWISFARLPNVCG